MEDQSRNQQDNIEELWDSYFVGRDIEIKNRILTHYIYLVVGVVKRMMPQYQEYCDKDDLVNTGILGLIDAVDKFDRSFDVKFQTYAAIRIRGEILDYLRKQDWASNGLRRKINTIQSAYEKLEAELNRSPTEKEVAARLGMREQEVIDVLQKNQMFNVVNLESILFEKEREPDGTSDLHDPYHVIENREMSEALHTAIQGLSQKERTVIVLYYYEGLTMKSIAEILGVTESRVSQIHSKTLLRMRQKIGED